MDKKRIIIISSVASIVILTTIGFLLYSLLQSNAKNKEMLQLAEMDKIEMQNEYEEFAKQYSEMQTQINNDSLIAQLEQERQRTEELLEELKRVKATDAAEILRLKKELATLRSILRSYVHEIDSLNRLNEQLRTENKQVRAQFHQATQEINTLTSEKETLTEQVAIASQLDAMNITVKAETKRGREAKKIKDVKKLIIGFTLAKNVTATTGNKTLYIRITKPNNEPLSGGGTFDYENTQLEYSIRKLIEYTGETTPVTVYWDVNEYLSAGTYRISIFADGNNIGTAAITFDK